MTVQQDRMTVRVPEQERADHHDATATATPATAAPRPAPGAWVTAEDRLFCHALLAGMLALGCYGALGVYLGTRVFG